MDDKYDALYEIDSIDKAQMATYSAAATQLFGHSNNNYGIFYVSSWVIKSMLWQCITKI